MGTGNTTGKRDLHILQHYERKKWCTVVPAGNLETKRARRGYRGTKMLPMHGGEQRMPSIVEMSRNTKVKRRVQSRK
jgi:hypothetical protein